MKKGDYVVVTVDHRSEVGQLIGYDKVRGHDGRWVYDGGPLLIKFMSGRCYEVASNRIRLATPLELLASSAEE